MSTSITRDPAVVHHAEHPGAELADTLERRGITVYRLAKAMGVLQPRVHDIIRGKRAITADTALRLGRALGTSPQFWLALQANYDLWAATEALGAALDAVDALPLVRVRHFGQDAAGAAPGPSSAVVDDPE